MVSLLIAKTPIPGFILIFILYDLKKATKWVSFPHLTVVKLGTWNLIEDTIECTYKIELKFIKSSSKLQNGCHFKQFILISSVIFNFKNTILDTEFLLLILYLTVSVWRIFVNTRSGSVTSSFEQNPSARFVDKMLFFLNTLFV